MKLTVVMAMLLVAWGTTALRAPQAKRKIMAEKGASTITYAMRHPMHEWEGVSREVLCALVYDDEARRIETVAATAKVSSFDSQNTNRDSHALESLEALKYPNVTFSSQDIKPGPNNTLAIRGNLTFHNVTRPVQMQATRRDANGRMIIEGEFDIKLSDFKVERPTLMMVPTEDEVKLKFSMAFRMIEG